MTGQVRFHGQTETRAPAYHLLVDGGASLYHGLGHETQEAFLDFVKAWKGHHGLRGSILMSRNQSWGPELWSTWLEGLERESPGTVILLSDFHGPLPDGPLWKVLTSRFWLRVIRFVHPRPNLAGRGEFLDSSSHQRHLYEPGAFDKAYGTWEEGLESFFRKAGIDESLLDQDSVEAMAGAFIKLI